MLAVAVFALVATAFTSGIVYGPQGAIDAGQRNRANALIEQAFAAADNIRSDAWNELHYTQTAVNSDTGEWDFDGEGTTQTIGEFTRTMMFDDVCRNTSNAIATCPATYTDPNTKQVTVSVTWSGRFGFHAQRPQAAT